MILNLITAPENSGYKCRPGVPLYLLTSNYSEREAAKAVGFWWNPDARRWYTTDPEKAARLLPCATADCAAQISNIVTARVQTAQLSSATDAAIDVPAPDGLAYLPFQKAGIAFILKNSGFDFSKPHSYIMGIGKEAGNAIGSVSKVAGVSGENDGVSTPGAREGGKRKGVDQATSVGTKQGVERPGVQSNEVQNGRTGNQREAPIGIGDGQEATRNELEGREWAGTNGNGQKVGSNPMSGGICQRTDCENSRTDNDAQTSAVVQGGLRESGNEMRDRTGWPLPSVNVPANEGQEENRGAGITRVDSVKGSTQLTKGGLPIPSRGVLLADEMG